MSERRAALRPHFGTDWWSLDVPGWRLLGINAQLLGSDLSAAQAQDAAIAEAAAVSVDRRLALFLHRPMFDRDLGETEITGRFVNPAPRHGWWPCWTAQCRRWSPAVTSTSIAAPKPRGTRHIWGTSTAYVIPDRLQPRYGTKEVGYVEHRLEPDGSHDSRLMQVAGVPTLNIADFPGAYGPL